MNPQLKKSMRIKRNTVKWKRLRQKVLERDGYRCQCCEQGTIEQLVLHHIYKSDIDHKDNLLTVCSICHIPWIHDAKNGWSKDRIKEQYSDRIQQFK